MDNTHRGTSCCQTKPTLSELIVKRSPICWNGFKSISSSSETYSSVLSSMRDSLSSLPLPLPALFILTIVSMSDLLRAEEDIFMFLLETIR